MNDKLKLALDPAWNPIVEDVGEIVKSRTFTVTCIECVIEPVVAVIVTV